MKIKVLGFFCILLFGAGRLHFEQQLSLEHRVASFHTASLNLDMRQKIGQMGFLAALSGFRSVVADVLWIQAHSAWQRTEWGRMKLLFDTVTSLQPHAILFWDTAAWHMAWNASIAALEDSSQPRQTLRIKAQREYFAIGEEFLLKGIQNNPTSALLYDRLGLLYRDKFRDHGKSAAAYELCMKTPNAPEYVKRFAAYELARTPGREQEGYQRLLALYRQGESEHLPTLLHLINDLEEKLNVPPGQKVLNSVPHQ